MFGVDKSGRDVLKRQFPTSSSPNKAEWGASHEAQLGLSLAEKQWYGWLKANRYDAIMSKVLEDLQAAGIPMGNVEELVEERIREKAKLLARDNQHHEKVASQAAILRAA